MSLSMEARVAEFMRLTQRCNSGEASVEEYDRWCELRADLARSDLRARRIRKRRYMRVTIDLPVELQADEARSSARCVDLSAGGMQLRALESTLPVGLCGDLVFRLPADEEVWRIACQVAWVAPDGRRCGVRFQNLAADAIEELRAAVMAEILLRQLTEAT
jgi:c-di-GMP-binding flagellar brake protein YcgR